MSNKLQQRLCANTLASNKEINNESSPAQIYIDSKLCSHLSNNQQNAYDNQHSNTTIQQSHSNRKLMNGSANILLINDITIVITQNRNRFIWLLYRLFSILSSSMLLYIIINSLMVSITLSSNVPTLEPTDNPISSPFFRTLCGQYTWCYYIDLYPSNVTTSYNLSIANTDDD
eukprot:63870_1